MEIDFNNITALINGVGFPIAICVYLLWYNKITIEKQQVLLNELKDIIRDIADEIKRGK